DVAEIQVKILDLAGPVATETDLGAGPEGPARLCFLAEVCAGGGIGAGDDDRHFDRITIGVDIDCNVVDETEAGAADSTGGLDPADGETAGRIDQGARRRREADAPAQRSKPLQPLFHSRA